MPTLVSLQSLGLGRRLTGWPHHANRMQAHEHDTTRPVLRDRSPLIETSECDSVGAPKRLSGAEDMARIHPKILARTAAPGSDLFAMGYASGRVLTQTDLCGHGPQP